MPNRSMTAGYGRLINHCKQVVPLRYLQSEAAARVELHRTEIVDGVSRMRAETAPHVPAGSVLELVPGGLHLMLHGVADGVVEGSELTLSLGTGADDVLRVRLPVRGMAVAGHAMTSAHPSREGHNLTH